METLKLRMSKNKGIIKFQIIQYASICEALLNYSIEKYFKKEFEERFSASLFCSIGQAISLKTKITYDEREVFLCSKKIEKAKVTWTSNPEKAQFALDKELITQATKEAYCLLYDLRNNTHILKAASSSYFPKPIESKNAYELVFKFINEIKAYFIANPIS